MRKYRGQEGMVSNSSRAASPCPPKAEDSETDDWFKSGKTVVTKFLSDPKFHYPIWKVVTLRR